jgi:AraC-like DNA-binding protein
MQRASDAATFVADPVGRYFSGATHLVWCHSPTLCGSMHWGRPSERDMRDFTRLLGLAHSPALAGGFDVYMDTRAVVGLDWSPMRVLSDYVRAQLPAWGRLIRRQAVYVPGGPVGVLLAGLVPLLGMTYPMRFFDRRGAALDWLGRADLVALSGDIERLGDELRRLSPTVRALRQHFESALGHANVESAARVLGTSTRSLQRELRAAGTSFTDELSRARVQAAQLMLQHSDDKIESIARGVGLASSQFMALFQRLVGETPARHRARLREAATGAVRPRGQPSWKLESVIV